MKRRISSILLAALLLTSLLPAAWAEEPSFGDVPGSHWASQFIRRAVGEGWVSGTGGGAYGPSETLTGAQFLTMVSNTFFAGEAEQTTVPGGAPWYAKYWIVAQEYGLNDNTAFQSQSDLSKEISRYDMAQVIMNVIAAQDEREISIDATEILKAHTAIADWSSVPQDYRGAVSAAYALGILSGKTGGNFAGSDGMTRAEAAAVLCHMADAILGGGVQPSQPETPEEPETPEQPEAPEEPEVPEQPEEPEQPQQPDQSQSAADELTAEVVRLVNVEREKEGLAPLGTYDSLSAAAQIRAPEIAQVFSHTRPDGSRCFTAMDETGAKQGAFTYGENIAAGNATAAATVEQWMNSPGHRANILNPDFTHIGVGYVKTQGGYRHYWVQMFVGKR